MAVTSVRFNSKEEKILKLLKRHYNCDTSVLLKRSLWELYEEIEDKKIIKEFEKKEKSNKTEFLKINELT